MTTDGALPFEMLFQQAHARPVTGEELETYGKYASRLWSDRAAETLTEAVIETVKRAALSPEQVRRVVEFANQDAYLREFSKSGSEHKVVHFEGGPADPSRVIQELNDGGGGTVFDPGGPGGMKPPPPGRKLGHARLLGLSPERAEAYEALLWKEFGQGGEAKAASADPYRPLKDLHDELSAAGSSLDTEIDLLEVDYGEVGRSLYEQVKQAALFGVPLGDIAVAFGETGKDPVLIKAAFELVTPRLRQQGVFASFDELGASITKVGRLERTVNASHPLVRSFCEYADVLEKLANLRELKAEVDEGLGKTETLLKEAVGGALGKAWQSLGLAGQTVGRATGEAARVLVGADPKAVGRVVSKGVQYGGAGLGVLSANAALQEVTDRPGVQRAAGALRSIVPGTRDYQLRRYRIMNS